MPWPHAPSYNMPYSVPAPYGEGTAFHHNYYPAQGPFHNFNSQHQQASQVNEQVADLQRRLTECQEALAQQEKVSAKYQFELEHDKASERERQRKRKETQENANIRQENKIREEVIQSWQKAVKEREDERSKMREELLRERQKEEEEKIAITLEIENKIRASIYAEVQRQEAEKRQSQAEMEKELVKEKLMQFGQTNNRPRQLDGQSKWEEADQLLRQTALQQTVLQEFQAKHLGEIQALAESLQRQLAELQVDVKRFNTAATTVEKKEKDQLPWRQSSLSLQGALAYQVFDDSEEEQGDNMSDDASSSNRSQSDVSTYRKKSVADTDHCHSIDRVRHGRLQVPRSRPWKGPGGIVPFIFSNLSAHIFPVYVRGNGKSSQLFILNSLHIMCVFSAILTNLYR